MVPFSGWSMPVQYAGIVQEHNAVRQSAGLFDVSHMGRFVVRGPQALDQLEAITTNRIARLEIGQFQYSSLPPLACPRASCRSTGWGGGR